MLTEFTHKTDFHNHLVVRGLTDDVRCWIDWNNEIVTFPLWHPGGWFVGYQKYSWNLPKLRSNEGKYYTWITEQYKPLGVWNLSSLSWANEGGVENSQRVLVTEGIWDAIRCIQCGYNAVAVLGATPNKEYVRWFRMVMQGKECIAILDNDGENRAGLGLTKLCQSSIMVEAHKDIGDYPFEEAQQWLDSKL